MSIGKTLDIVERNNWRKWLSENYDKEKEVWLIFPKKSSNKLGLSYDDAVEEALCFGWIDSKIKRVDEKSYAQRFSPRTPKTKYSETNKKRLRKLVAEGKVIPSVKENLAEILNEE